MKNEIEILGQVAASTLFSGQIRQFQETEEFTAAILVFGPAGVGKSYTAEKFAKMLMEISGANLIQVDAGSQFSRADSEPSVRFIQALSDSALGQRTIVLVDEAQLLPLRASAKPSPMQRLWQGLLYGAGQKWGRSGSIEIEGNQVEFDTRNIQLILMTNFPDKVIPGNKNAASRRFLGVKLQRYSHDVIKQVIASYFEHKSLKVHADVRAKLEKMHRGTLEALDDFRQKLAGFPLPLTMESFKQILPTCSFTVRGFTHGEIAAMHWIATTVEPTLARYVLQKFPDLDAGALYRHAQEQRIKIRGGGEETVPFLVMHGSRYVVTDAGKAFLKTLA